MTDDEIRLWASAHAPAMPQAVWALAALERLREADGEVSRACKFAAKMRRERDEQAELAEAFRLMQAKLVGGLATQAARLTADEVQPSQN